MKKYYYAFVVIALVILVAGCSKKEENQEIKTFSYETSSFGVISEAAKIDMNDRTKKIFINNDFRKGGKPTSIDEISDDKFVSYEISDIKRFQKNIIDTGVKNWKDRYEDKHMLDGFQWEIIIEYQGGKTNPIYGSNAKPKKYDELMTILFDADK